MTIKVPLAPRHAALVLRAVQALKPEELTADERDALPHVEARLIRAMGKHGAPGRQQYAPTREGSRP